MLDCQIFDISVSSGYFTLERSRSEMYKSFFFLASLFQVGVCQIEGGMVGCEGRRGWDRKAG